MPRKSKAKKSVDSKQNKKLKALERKLNRMGASEEYHLDVTAYNATLPVLAAITGQPLTNMAQGDAEQNRGGNAVNGIRIIGHITVSKIASNNTFSDVRLLIVRPKVLGADLVNTTFMDSTGPTLFRQWDQKGSYDFVFDKLFRLGRIDGGSDTKVFRYDIKIPASKSLITYDGTGSTVEETVNNHLVAFAYISDVTTSDVNCKWHNRFIYNP